MYNESGKPINPATLSTEDYTSWLHLEPLTGIAIQSSLKSQWNLLIQHDDMFKMQGDIILPLVQVEQKSKLNFGNKNSIFAGINTDLRWKEILTLCGYICGSGFLILTVVIWVGLVRKKLKIRGEQEDRVRRRDERAGRL